MSKTHEYKRSNKLLFYTTLLAFIPKNPCMTNTIHFIVSFSENGNLYAIAGRMKTFRN